MSQLALIEKIEFRLIRTAGQSKLCKSVIIADFIFTLFDKHFNEC